MTADFSLEYAPLLNATFHGYVNLGGHQYKNIDADRDGCELHLHRFSGMISAKRLNVIYFIAANCVQSMEVDMQGADHLEPPASDELMEMAAESIVRTDALKKTVEDSSTEAVDRILADLGHVAPNLSDSGTAKRQKRTKKGE